MDGKRRDVFVKAVYVDSSENRKKGRVGRQYGGTSSGDKKSTEARKRVADGDIKAGSKFSLPNGETIQIKRLFKESNDEPWVEYNRSGGSSQQGKNENSVKQLRQFLNNWGGTKSGVESTNEGTSVSAEAHANKVLSNDSAPTTDIEAVVSKVKNRIKSIEGQAGDRKITDEKYRLQALLPKLDAQLKSPRGDIKQKFNAELKKLRATAEGIKKIDPTSPTYKKMTKYLEGLDNETLKLIANSNIKWFSMLAGHRATPKMYVK